MSDGNCDELFEDLYSVIGTYTGRKNGFTSVCQGVQMWCKFGALNLN